MPLIYDRHEMTTTHYTVRCTASDNMPYVGSPSGMILQRNVPTHYYPTTICFVLLSSRYRPVPSRLAVPRTTDKQS